MTQCNRIDPEKLSREQAFPGLTQREAEALEKAKAASPLRTLYTSVADKVHWYLLDSPVSLRGKHFGVADSRQEAEETISRLLGPTMTTKAVFL